MKKIITTWIAAISILGLFATSIITAITENSYTAVACLIFVCVSMFQLGISTDNLFEKQNIPKEPTPIHPFVNIFGWIFPIAIMFCIGMVYKITVWDLLPIVFLAKVFVIIFLVPIHWFVPYIVGYITGKHVPKLKNILAY